MEYSTVDCIVVGFNDMDLAWIDSELKIQQNKSGAYKHWQANTLVYKNKRRHVTDLFNTALTDSRGTPHYFHIANTPNLACCILKSFLEERGHATEIVNFFNRDKEQLISLLNLSPKVVAITTTVYTEARPVIEIVDFIKEYNDEVKVVVGGPHIYNTCSDHDIILQDYLFNQMNADIYVNDSQGELTLHRILSELKRKRPDLSRIPNIVYAKDRKNFERTERQIENNSLSENVINWTLFDQSYVSPEVWMRTARSCAFKCAFCRYPVLGGELTLLDMDDMESQFDLLQSLGIKFIYFIDDTFNVPLPRFKNMMRMMIRKKYDFKWASYFRCANADEETFDLMSEAGCTAVFAGIESGDQTVLKNMNKAAKIERYKYGMNMLHERGIIVYTSFIIGFPGETEETVENTLNFIKETKPAIYSAEAYYHDPKAPIAARTEEYGLEGRGYSWRHNTMDWLEAHNLVEMIHREITDSKLMPFYGGDLWTLSHLMQNGFSLEKILGFLDISQRMIVKGFDEPTPDYSVEEAELNSYFSPDVVGPSCNGAVVPNASEPKVR